LQSLGDPLTEEEVKVAINQLLGIKLPV
jgi:hypothetical protein